MKSGFSEFLLLTNLIILDIIVFMIKENTVLILGAGASEHLGYPLGLNLLEFIDDANFLKRFEYQIISYLDKIKFSKEKLKSFYEELKWDQSFSIDEFLSRREEYLDIGKLFITYVLKECENKVSFGINKVGWYKYLFHKIIEDTENIESNKLYILTFNYDYSLEYFLFKSLKTRKRLNNEETKKLLDCIPIFHIHGSLYYEGCFENFGSKPIHFNNEKMAHHLETISKNIKIISEINDKNENFCLSIFETSNYILRNAKKIYFLGFGFHDLNMKRFKFFYENRENLKNKEIKAAIGDQWRQNELIELNTRLDKYGIKKGMLYESSCNDFFRTWTSLD